MEEKTINNVVHCDECNAKITIRLQQRRLSGAVELNYFTCPECEKEYTCYYTDTTIRSLQRKVVGLWSRLHKTAQADKRQRIKDQIDREKSEIRRQMDALKLRMRDGL